MPFKIIPSDFYVRCARQQILFWIKSASNIKTRNAILVLNEKAIMANPGFRLYKH